MTENIENLMLEHLKAIRAQLDRIERDVQDLKARMGSLEVHSVATQGEVVRHSARFDEFDSRLSRVERRLELRDAQ